MTKTTQLQQATRKQTIGTSKVAEIKTTFDALVQTFGEPHFLYEDDKVQAEWAFVLDNGLVFTIHDYKDSNELGQVTQWSIGGKGINGEQIAEQVCERIIEVTQGVYNASVTQ